MTIVSQRQILGVLARTNCHIHTFTVAHVPSRFAWPLGLLLRVGPVRRALLAVLQLLDRKPRGRFARYARILEVSHSREQEVVYRRVRGYYPPDTRFVVLPMDMTHMGAGKVRAGIDQQHTELRQLRDRFPPGEIIPFAAADPRSEDVVNQTVRLLQHDGFRGIKLYPPLGYHPNDPALRPLYAYAAEHGYPVLAHCSRGGVRFRGTPTLTMRTDPVTGNVLPKRPRAKVLHHLTDPDNYVPILKAHPTLRICLAHFGGASDWEDFLDHPWDADGDSQTKSWLAKIADLIRSGEYDNLYTDISYTLFANEEYVHLLKVLLTNPRLRRRVLFGSDFYVVENAELEERRISVRLRSVLGEATFRAIAEDNPRSFLGEEPAGPHPAGTSSSDNLTR